MQHFIGMLATALDLRSHVAETAVAVVLDAIRSCAHPADYHALCAEVPEIRAVLDPQRRRALGNGSIKGPAPQLAEDLQEEIRTFGLGVYQGLLLVGFTVRFLRGRVGDGLLLSILAHVPALDVVELEDVDDESARRAS